MDIQIYCYRYYGFQGSTYDEELIWQDVSSYGGHISIRGDCIDFYVPRAYVSFFILKYPELTRQHQLEYV